MEISDVEEEELIHEDDVPPPKESIVPAKDHANLSSSSYKWTNNTGYNHPTIVYNWSKRRNFKDTVPPVEVTSQVPDKMKLSKNTQGNSVVMLNVGGVYYTTLRTTLLRFPESMLAAMFSGRHDPQQDSRGAHFIDRNGTYFGYILEFLRSDKLPPSEVAVGVLMEARYYALDELEDRMAIIPSISALVVKENHRAQFPEYQENKKRIVQIAMENATVTKTGEVLIYAYRTAFVPKAANFNINHHCAADQAHISIGPWESIADEETLIKCIESDLIDEHFNVKVHEGKRRCKYFYGQSCQKCIFRVQIIFG